MSNYRLLNKVPLIININGRSFHKITSLLDKPYCTEFAEGMLSTTVKLCMEIDGALFAYQHNDEITIVARNDQTQETLPWYDNKLQKICSITSSIATQHFNLFAVNTKLNLMGDALFTSQVFVVPTIAEAINTIIYKQQSNFYLSIQFACFYELLKKYDKTIIKEMLSDLSIDEKIDLLKQECDIDFNEYHTSFRRGAACYKIPKIVNGVVKNKWAINTELPIFTKDQSFLSNIFKNGADIFRSDSI
jgi:tRNA(His) 5'-end guanylyltransferase